jgi:hypothetical protein
LVFFLSVNLSFIEPPNKACTPRLVGVYAFSGTLCGLERVPAKWRGLVPPTSG